MEIRLPPHGPALSHASWWKGIAGCLPFHGIVLVAAAGLKLFYRRAGADDLAWILAPTARVTELLSEIHFDREARSGWISHPHRLILGPGCAGVNFLTIAFLVLSLPFLHRFKSRVARGAWLGGSFGVAFLLAVATNSLRIVAAARLYEMDIYGGWITPERLHRLAGIVLYAVSLMLAYSAVESLVPPAAAHRDKRPIPAALVPLAGYLAVTLGVPLAGRATGQGSPGFLEHAAWVLLICLILATVAWGLGRVLHRRGEGGPPRRHESRGTRC
jgi:exosortase K